MRWISSIALVAVASTLIMGTACDSLRLPGPPAKPADTSTGTRPTASAPKPNRAPTRAVKADPALEGPRFDQIRRGLRRLVVAEETYYAENGVYTDDMSRVGFKPDRDMQLRFLWVSRIGWAASGTHAGIPGQDCVIYVGRGHGAPTTLRELRTGAEGVPVCDGTGSRRRTAPTASAATPTPAAAETPATALPDTGSALNAVEPTVQMKVDLRNLVRSQDTWYAQQGAYSRRTEPFALQYLWHRGVKITILSANDDSWSARATHVSQPGKSCVIWLGPVTQKPATDVQQLTPDQPAVPACDE
jgi:hypothetical protein